MNIIKTKLKEFKLAGILNTLDDRVGGTYKGPVLSQNRVYGSVHGSSGSVKFVL